LERDLSDTRSRADIAETSLRKSEGTAILREVSLTFVGVILGAAFADYEKLGIGGTLVAVGIAVCWLFAVVRSRSKGAGE
jgi:hypothetical protein